MKPRLFGTSGIRGKANLEVTPQLAQRVGAALASQLDGGAIAVGRDTRLSGEMLETALISGIVSCGVSVKVVGVTPTPALAYLTRELKATAGVAVSASHNPPQYNGFKLFDSTGRAYGEEAQLAIEERMEREESKLAAWDGIGEVERMDVRNTYMDAVVRSVKLGRRWRVACDLFNGATCVVVPDILRKLRCRATLLNAQPDGHFPSGDPEPTVESLHRLGRMVEASGADIGFAFDGDGDRMMAVDERGLAPTPDRTLAAYARFAVERNGGGTVVTHVGASMCIDEAVAEAGGSVARTKVGDVSIAEAIAERSAVFGGESVGAWIHPDVHPCPDGVLSAIRLLEALEKRGETLSEFVANVPDYPIMSSKVECPNEEKGRVMEAVSARFEDVFEGARSVSRIDGLRVDLEGGWVLIRPSGTEPVIRVTAEARETAMARRLMEAGARLVSKAMEEHA